MSKKKARLDYYIKLCDEVLDLKDLDKAKELEEEIVCVYTNEITNITEHLDNYGWVEVVGQYRESDYIGDIKKLKAILINHMDNISSNNNFTQEKSEKNIVITNTNYNTSSSNAYSYLNLSIDEFLASIHNTILTKEERNELEDKLSALELSLRNNNKEKSSEKAGNVLKYIADKGIDAIIAVLPYILTMLNK